MPRFDTPLNTNDHSFDRVLVQGLPVLLVVWDGAALDPALDDALRALAKTEAGHLLVAKLNALDNPATGSQVGGERPVLVAYRDGQELSRTEALTPQAIRPHADYALGRGPRPSSPPPAPRQGANGHSTNDRSHIARPVTVSDSNFRQVVLESPLPVLVDLWAPWCGPCHRIAPAVEKLAADFAGQLTVAKLNIDQNPLIAGRFQVQGIPTLLVFRDGQVVDRIVGAVPEPALRSRVQAALGA